ncbi:fumarate hydratase, partial [Mycobacteroides abscessus subsp. massiliense]|uniref:fumarate hydratase n=1 Tax=Mycobacteroides abscessus TaxID=36809 RepID=UPI003CEB8F17
EVKTEQITAEIRRLCIEANRVLPCDLEQSIRSAAKTETSPTGRSILEDLGANMDAARELNLPVCQDTGMAVIFAEVGQDVHITGGSFEDAVNEGVHQGYLDG